MSIFIVALPAGVTVTTVPPSGPKKVTNGSIQLVSHSANFTANGVTSVEVSTGVNPMDVVAAISTALLP